MLERLYEIDWDAIGSSDVPIWINELASKNRQIKAEAAGNLMEHIVPWECLECSCLPEQLLYFVGKAAAYLTVPFLIELLSEDALEDKELILEILQHLALYIRAKVCIDKDRENTYMEGAHRVFEVVYSGIDIYRKLAETNQTPVSEEAIALLNILARYK